jgi:hypothetical protein
MCLVMRIAVWRQFYFYDWCRKCFNVNALMFADSYR